MSDNIDFYQILGVDKNVDDQALKKAWRKFSMKWHPDMQHGKSDEDKKAAEEMFKKGQAAYECLSDPEKRKIYDAYGIDGLQGHAQRGGFSGGMPSNLADFIRKHMQNFGFHFGYGPDSDDEDFGNPFGFNRQQRRAPSNLDPEDGKSFRIRMEIDLEDIIYGAEKEFTMDGFNICPDCHGHKCESFDKCSICNGQGMIQEIRGNTIIQSTCPSCSGSGYSMKNICKKCNGNGRVQAKRQIKIKIPKGFPENGQLRVKGGGIPGLNGGQNGDLFIVVQTKKHSLFSRNGELNLEETVYINPLLSVIGGNIAIPTPYDLHTQYISPGTKNGQTIRIHGYGIRRDDSTIAPFGDLIVNIVYDSFNSSALSQSEKEAIKTAYNAISNNKECLINSNRQWKEINNNTKLPWIINIDKK